MSNLIYDGFALLSNKVDDPEAKVKPANMVVHASEWNTSSQALKDTRSVLLESGDARFYGAKLDGVTDDAPAITAALAASNTVRIPAGVTVKLGSPIVLGAGKALIGGEGSRPRLLIEHGGVGIDMTANESYAAHFLLTTNSFGGVYTGLRLGHNTVYLQPDDIGVYYAAKGLVFKGESDFHNVTNFVAMWNDQAGIEFESYLGNIGSGNLVQFLALIGPGDITGADHGTGIICAGGAGANTFIGGSIGLWKIPVEMTGSNNRLINVDAEHFRQGPTTHDNGIMYWDSHLYIEGYGASTSIDPNTRIIANADNNCTLETYIPQPEANWEGLKGAWFFNEGSGKYALDWSGNNRLITYKAGTVW
jgi:hypothetical protein